MKHICNCALREFMSDQLKTARKKNRMTQAEFASELNIDTRSYVDLEHGDSLCCMQTFVMFLDSFCPDKEELIAKLKAIILLAYNENEEDSAS